MGVMSIPCCDVTTQIKKTGPVFVRAGWHHFVIMTKTGDITTWVPKTPLIIDTAGVTTDYWETNLDKRNYLKYRSSTDWYKLDTTYDINTRGVCGSCRELSDGNSSGSTNLYLDDGFKVSVFQNLQCCVNLTADTPDPDLSNCSATAYPEDHQCHAKCSYTSRWDGEMFGTLDSDKETPFPSGYMNLDGSTDGTGVSLSIRGSPDSARWVNWETPAEKAPPKHPLATPDFGGLLAKDVECGAYHNIVRLSDDSIMAWGLNSMGQCNVPESLLPSWLRPAGVAAHPKKRKIFSLHCGFSTSAVMFNDGTVLCWGDPEVADEVNTWKFIKTSPIKRTASGEISCDGATSVGHPELLPDGNPNNPSDWVAEELYKDSKYNANTDWWGHWHNNKTPGFPHFDLGVVTDYVNPVNWKYVTDGNPDDPDGDQWSYRFATKSGPDSLCARKGKNIKDYAVAMLRTGQIITTRKENAPNFRKDNGLLCRDCSTDLVLTPTDGAYKPTHATCAVADITIDGGDAGGLDCIDLALLYCNGGKCDRELKCEAFKKLSFPTELDCSNGYLNNHPAEGVGCFSSSPQENRYDPNWAVHTKPFESAGHARGLITEGASYPTWNTAQANYGWASLPSASMRMRGWNSLIPLACKDKVFLSNCLTIVGQNDPCNAECPSNPERGNIIGAPAGTAGSYKGNNGYFRYPEHLLGFGCVAGTNTTCWLGPARMLSESRVGDGLAKFDGVDFNGNSIPSTIVGTYSQIPLTSTRGGPCAECAFSGSSILHEFHLANISTGCRFHDNLDPDGDRNPLIDGGICLNLAFSKFDNQSKMMPSKPWGPFQLSTNIGNLPNPPIMESLVVERGLGATPYTVPFNGINGSLQPGGWDFRTSPLTCGIKNSKLSNSIQNQTNQTYSKYIEFPQEFKYFSGTVNNSGFTPIAAAYTGYSTCVCWPNQSGDSMFDGSQCDGGSIDGSSEPACGSGRLLLDCGLSGKRYNPTQSPASRLFGTGFTLEEYAMSKGILCSAISINENSFATAGIAVKGKCTINIWSTQKQNIPNKPLKTIEFGGQNISGIKYISNDELFIRFDENTNRSFGILNITTGIFESIEIDLYDSSTTSPYNIGTDSPVVNNVISSNQTAVSLKQAGSNSFRFATVNTKCDKVLLFKYVDSSVGLTLEASFSATDIFSDLINTIPTNFSPIISGLEISKDGNKIAIGEGTDLFSTVVWGLATCAGTSCIRDDINGLTLGLSKNYYTELPSYEIIRDEGGNIERLNGPSQNVIRFNKSETSIGVYGRKANPANGGTPSQQIWEATIWNLCYSSNSSPVCSTIVSKNQIFSIDDNDLDSGGSIPSSIIVNFSNDLSHIAGAFCSSDLYSSDSDYRSNISTIFYKNMLSNDSKIISNVYNEDAEYTRNITSINFIPNTNNMLVTFFRDQPFPGDNNKISEAIVVDYTTRNVGNSYPLWKRKLCGYRGGVRANPPPTTWKGEYPLGCFTGWEKSVEHEQENRFSNVSVGENICKCDESPSNDLYNRWMWNNPTLSYASGRTWAVHLRRSPWYRDRNNASVFKWKSGCEEFPEWGSDQIDTSGHIQKAYSHVINNYDDVKIWISGWMHDPCPPWPLDTWDSDLDIDIPLPPTEKESSYVVTANNNIDTRGFTTENGTTFSMIVENSAKYPSWVPVPKASPTNERQGYSYKGRWIKNGTTSQWAQGLYGIDPNVCGFTGSIDRIVSSFGISAAYQSFCTESETPWTEEKPNVDTYVTANYCYYGGAPCLPPDP